MYGVYSIHIILITNTGTVKAIFRAGWGVLVSGAGVELRGVFVCGIQGLAYNVRKLEEAVTMSHLPAGAREFSETEDV